MLAPVLPALGPDLASPPRVICALRLADTALVLGHRLSEWASRAPTLEEDIALANLGLDLIGQARLLYAHAGELEGKGRTEDDLAYLRDEHAYLNLLIVELPNGDFAQTMARHLLYGAFAHPFHTALAGSSDPTLAAIGAKAEKEMAYHLRHASEWLIRLGDGTEESHARAQKALDLLMPWTGEMFEADAVDEVLIADGVLPDPRPLEPVWRATVEAVLAEATLAWPKPSPPQLGGRRGRHTEHLGPMLAVMQSLHRAHPGARW